MQLDDSGLFDDAPEIDSAPGKSTWADVEHKVDIASTQSSAPAPPALVTSPPPPLMDAPQAAQSPVDSDPFGSPKKVDKNDNGWDDNDVFKSDPFASFANDNGDDPFGFPEPKTAKASNNNAKSDDAFASFDIAGDSWGEPQMLPVDFTPRKSNNNNVSFASANFGNPANDLSDGMSFDGTEMSEVTNPTFVSSSIPKDKPDPEGDGVSNKGSKQRDDDLETSQAPSESANPIGAEDSDGEGEEASGVATATDSSKENHNSIDVGSTQSRSAGGKKLPPSYTSQGKRSNNSVDPPIRLDTMDSSEDERDDREDLQAQPQMAKSRILSKYGSRRRRQPNPNSSNASLGTIHSGSSPARKKNESSTSSASIRSSGSMGSTTADGTTARASPMRKTGSVQSTSSTSKGLAPSQVSQRSQRGQGYNKNQSKVQDMSQSSASTNNQEQQLAINPATTSASYRRRRMPPTRNNASSTVGNVSSSKASVGLPSRSIRKKKVSPSVVDNPAYYSVSNQFHAHGLDYFMVQTNQSFVSYFQYMKMDSRLVQIKDPIQRAGVRLLWAAAIPIQTQARRFLARQAAIKRMCSVLTIQAVSSC